MPAHTSNDPVIVLPIQFQCLRAQDVPMIEDALKQVGACGEVHLIVEQGRLGYVRTLQSESLSQVASRTSPE
ncbi:MAG: hypothetical protein HZC40_00005 [Chloroflexi bacterium]|nr:hypothetical protein [Chloroflexota bacterium]